MDWNYSRVESNNNFDTRIPVGDHRIRIKDAQKNVSSAGNDMLTLTFEVSGYKGLIFHHITFLKDRPEITNRMLTQFFDAFGDIPAGDLNPANWIGKVGACKVKHEEYNGNTNAKVDYFIRADKQGNLPAWQEPDGGSGNAGGNDFINVPAGMIEEMPF